MSRKPQVTTNGRKVLITNFFWKLATYDVVVDYIEHIETTRMQRIHKDNLDDRDLLKKNLRILWKNRNIDIGSAPNDLIDFVFFIIFRQKDLYNYNESKKNGYYKRGNNGYDWCY